MQSSQNGDTVKTATPIIVSARMRMILFLAVLVALATLLYREVCLQLMISVLHREGSSHGVFVPFISGYFLWLKRERIKTAKLDSAILPGITMAVAGLFIFFLERGSSEITLPALSFLLVTAGLVVGLFGKVVFREVRFPLLFLVTMIPLPESLYTQIADWMKAISTAGSVWLVSLIGVPIYREVYNIFLPETTLHVSPSCSGIRYFLSFAVFGLAYAFLFKKSLKSRVIVLLATIPISIIAGVLRLSTIFLAAHYISPVMAQRQPHILLSWGVFVVVLAGAVLTDRLITSQKAKGEEQRAKSVRSEAEGTR
jgi:exosortase